MPLLSAITGVRKVHVGGSFGVSLDRGPELIGADDLWGGPSLPTAGQGVKIGVIDDGVDQTHPFFDPSGYSYPAGFPKGQTSFTTPEGDRGPRIRTGDHHVATCALAVRSARV